MKSSQGYFFSCHLTVPWPALGHSQGDSLANFNLMLITVFVQSIKWDLCFCYISIFLYLSTYKYVYTYILYILYINIYYIILYIYIYYIHTYIHTFTLFSRHCYILIHTCIQTTQVSFINIRTLQKLKIF